MKKLNLLFALVCFVISTSAFSSDNNFYECKNIGGIEEWEVVINLSQGKALFFDNDNNHYLRFTSRFKNADTGNSTYTFEGADLNDEKSDLYLIFDYIKKGVALYSVKRRGHKLKLIGDATCKPGKARPLSADEE